MATIGSTSSTGSATFTASGLASGMDTASIVDQLVALESQPITLVQNQQNAIKMQISRLGSIVASLSSLQGAADDLGSNGVFRAKVTSANTGFSTAAGTGAVAGRYSVEVDQLAQASKWRSSGFASGQTMAGGTVTLTVQGKTYSPITIQDQTSLADVASAIRQSGAPVSAVVLNDGTKSYLSITAQDTGYPGQTSAAALGIDYHPPKDAGGNPVAQAGQDPQFAQIQEAKNASVTVDQLQFTRRSNVISDIIPGATLTLTKANPGQSEDLVLATDPSATQARLQKFVDSYNGVMALVQSQLAVSQSTDRTTSLVGFGSVRALQAQLQVLVATPVPGLANVRTLADVGLQTNKDDGSLSINATTLQRALSQDPAAVNALFSTAGTGLSAMVDQLVDANTQANTGALAITRDSLNKRVSDMDDEILTMQNRVDAYRKLLTSQFTAMETTLSALKTTSNFLTTWSNQSTGSSSK